MNLIILALIAQMSPLEMARQNIAVEQFDSAIPILEAYSGPGVESGEARELLLYALQARAKRLFTAGNLSAAMVDLNRAAQIEPNDPNVRRGIIAVHVMGARKLLAEGDTDAAEEAYRRALEMDTSRADIRRMLASLKRERGRALESAGRALEALTQYRLALEIDSGNVEAHLAIGQIYYSREEFALAQHHFREARKLTTQKIVGLDELLGRIDREFQATRTHQTLEMEGFLVRFEGGHRPDLFYQVLPILRDSRDRAARILERTVRQPLSVIFYANESFQRAVDAPDWAVGLYDGKVRLREAELTQPPSYLARIVRHEIAHAVLEEVAPGKAPAWVHEGFAKYAELEQWDKLQDAPYLVDAIKAGRCIPLSALNTSFARLGTGADVRLAYVQSAAAVRYLAAMHGERSISNLVSLLSAGRSIEKAVDSVTFYSLDDFQKRVNDWVIWEYGQKR